MASDSSEDNLSCQEKVHFQLPIAAPCLFGLVVTSWSVFTLTVSKTMPVCSTHSYFCCCRRPEALRSSSSLIFSVQAHP